MAIIYLMRHGETDYNKAGFVQGRLDIPLNETGEAQAQRSGKSLQKVKRWDRIIASPLTRAFRTAEIINEHLQLGNITIMEDFIERDYGEGAGMTREERFKKFQDCIAPGQESKQQVQTRGMVGLEKVKELYDNQNILIVTHGGVINALLAKLSNGEIGTGKTLLHNVCLNQISYNGTAWQVDFYNCIDYLQGEDEE